MEGRRTRSERALMPRLWSVLDPAVDALPDDEVPARVVHRIHEAFGATAVALHAVSEYFGTPPGDPAWPSAAERIEIDVQDGLGTVGTLSLAFEAPGTLSE